MGLQISSRCIYITDSDTMPYSSRTSTLLTPSRTLGQSTLLRAPTCKFELFSFQASYRRLYNFQMSFAHHAVLRGTALTCIPCACRTIRVTDGSGNIAYSSPVVIQEGSSSSCLTSSSSSSATAYVFFNYSGGDDSADK